MQINELVELGKFLQIFVQENNLHGMLQELINSVNNAAQNQNPEEVKVNLGRIINLHNKAEKRILSPAQRKIMEDFGADEILGKKALDYINKVFAENQANPTALVEGLQKQRSQTKQFMNKATQLVSVLEPLIENLNDHTYDLKENEGRLWLYFAEDTSVNTIEDLENAAETWRLIIHHFSRFPNAQSIGGRILQIKKQSPLELELASDVAVLVPLAFGVKWVLNRIEHVIKICQEAEKLKQLKIKTKIIDDLYAEADEQRKKIAVEGADAIKEEFDADPEARNAAEKALKTILEFIEGGGQLDIDVEESDNEEDIEEETGRNRAQLRELMTSIRKNIKLIPLTLSDQQTTVDPENK